MFVTERHSVSRAWPGIAACILAGAIWGLVFLAPRLAADFSPLQLSAGRYVAYGLVAAALLARGGRRVVRSLRWRDWRTLAWLGLTGNIVYYVLLAWAIQHGGVAMPSFVIGLLPIAITLVGSREHGAVPLRRLAPSLLLSAAGLACTGWQSLNTQGLASLPALLCACGALACWTVYVVINSRALGRLPHVSSHDWSLLIGIVTGGEALLLLAPAVGIDGGLGVHDGAAWLRFAGLSGAVAVLASVVGNALWNRASRVLPLTMMGQMIVFESLFASLYGFLWERRWPAPLEVLALVLLVAGVAACAAAHGPGRAGRR